MGIFKSNFGMTKAILNRKEKLKDINEYLKF